MPARLPAGFLRVTSPGLASLLLPIDAFDTSTHQVMGRRIAGSSFAKGMAASLKPGDQFTVFTGSREALPALQALLQPVMRPGAQVQLQADLDPTLISRSGCLHLPDPGLHQWCWLRADGASSRFSLTGVTHTLCSHRVMQGLEQLVTAPLEPWDALVCTSRSALQVVQEAMTCMHERLERRFQQTLPSPIGPQLPLIPLGVDPDPFHWRGRFTNRQEQRLLARQQLGLSPTARVVLFLGRLSFHSKAHPLPLYRALDRLSADHELVLLECGHIFNADIAAAYDQLGQRFPHLTLRRLGGLTPASEEEKKMALAAADLFCSPADNLQETFGLSVLEAMASSLPVVASDWNGYRDLVVHGSTGWLVPCRDALQVQHQPDALDRLFSLGLKDYDSTVGLRSLGVVLDHVALERALGDLLAAPERCAAMGEAGRERIESVFSWRVVSEQYRELWSELGQRRATASLHGDAQSWPMAHAARLFAAHASAPPSAGPWWLDHQGSDPSLLTDSMQTCFLQQLIPMPAMVNLADTLRAKRRQGGQWLNTDDLEQLYGHCGVPTQQWSRLTNLLEKLAIVIAASP